MKNLLLNRKLLIIIGVVLAIILFYGYGCYQNKQGKKEAKIEAENNALDAKINSRTDSIAYFKTILSHATDSINTLNKKYDLSLSNQSLFQKKAEQQKRYYTSIIAQLSDSIKLYKVDSLKDYDKTLLLVRYYNYPILQSQYDTCKATNSILEHKVSGDSLELSLCNKTSEIQDSLIADYKKQNNLLKNQIPKKRPILNVCKKIGCSIMALFTLKEGYDIYKELH